MAENEDIKAYLEEMEELRQSDPLVHDFRVILAKYSQGAEMQKTAISELLQVVAYAIKGKEDKQEDDS